VLETATFIQNQPLHLSFDSANQVAQESQEEDAEFEQLKHILADDNVEQVVECAQEMPDSENGENVDDEND